MEKQYNPFIKAARDLNLNDVPFREESGNFQFTEGQLPILLDPQFSKLREDTIELNALRREHRKVKGEIESYQGAANALKVKYTKTTGQLESKIEKEEDNLKSRKFDLGSFEEHLIKRGEKIPVVNVLSVQPEAKKDGSGRNWKSIVHFLVTWLIGELFMSYVIWNDLREDKTIEDLVVRSLSFGVVLFLVHLVTVYNKKDKKPIYYCFLGFSMITLLIMLFGPLILNKVYPTGEATSSTVDQWSMKNGEGTNQEVDTDSVPLWVDLYRDYEMMPAVLCFLFFIAIQSFTTRNKVAEKESALESKPEPNPVELLFNNYNTQVKRSEDLLEKLRSGHEQTVDEYRKDLDDIRNQQQKSYETFSELQKKINLLEASCEQLLNKIEQELNAYKIEYLDLLRDDDIKKTIIKPEWPNRSDILNYYKINTL